jgi:hypothetical protein
LVAALVESGIAADQDRQAAFRPFWARVVEADTRLAVLRDDEQARGEIEGRLTHWKDAREGAGFASEWSRPEVIALAERVQKLDAELAELFNETRALGHVAESSELAERVGPIILSLAAAFDALEPAVVAAQGLAGLPRKAGGPGDYTANLRRRPVEVFGEALVAIFRRSNIPIGGNFNKDKRFEAFICTAHEFVEGRPVPGLGVMLARLRKG